MQERKEIIDDISLLRFDKDLLMTDDQILKTSKLFSEVFRGHPWYEVNKCVSCSFFFGENSTSGETCPHCQKGILEEAYPIEETMKKIIEVENKPSASIYLMENQQKEVVGFGWGHLKSVEKSVIKFDEEVRTKETEIFKKILGDRASVFSVSEIGIRKNCRGRGFGKILVGKLINDAREFNAPVSIWTRNDTILTLICLKNNFTQIFGPEVKLNGDKVVLTGNIIVDTYKQVPERVFFIKDHDN